MTEFVDATFYVQIAPEYNGRPRDTAESVYAARAVAMTQKKPDKPKPGTVMTKLTVRVPKAAFVPLRPEAVIVIPENMLQGEPIQIEAGDPS